MEYLPLQFDIKGRPCLLVGGGHLAFHKARSLLGAGAALTIVAPEICQELNELVNTPGLEHIPSVYDDSHLDGRVLVVAATNDEAVNRRVSTGAKARQIPVNVVDQPDLCTVIFPAVIDRDPIVISVASSATSPTLTRVLKSRIESMIPPTWGKLASFLGDARKEVKSLVSADARRWFWEQVINGPIAEQVLMGNEVQARKMLSAFARDYKKPPGEVYLVGAGPGDPELLTLKAVRLMQQADVILYDNLVSPEVLGYARREAKQEYVGKRPNEHSIGQLDLNNKIVSLAKKGQRVLRLKGGDPFIFGRGGEEMQVLAEHEIPFQVVPGITAALGCASYAGIPLTHRDYAQSVRFVTASRRKGAMDLPWHEFATPDQTVVFYMGRTSLREICQRLIEHGRDPDTPIALVARGTMPDQVVIEGTLSSIPDMEKQNVKPPTLVIVGEVVALRSISGQTGQHARDLSRN